MATNADYTSRLSDQFPSTSDLPRPISRGDRTLNAMAVFDQAIQSLFELRDLTRAPRPPRSLLLDFIQLSDRFARNDRFVSQVGLLISAGQSVLQLGSEWKRTMQRPERSTSSDQWAQYYKVASLAAASLAVAWLLVRKR